MSSAGILRAPKSMSLIIPRSNSPPAVFPLRIAHQRSILPACAGYSQLSSLRMSFEILRSDLAATCRIRPSDSLGDHRRRHPRKGRQQFPDPRLGRISHRPRWPTLILRRASRGQRRLHRVPRNPQYPCDLRNRQLLRPAHPPDLCPVLHAQHSLPPWLVQPTLSRKLAKIELPRSGQYSVAVDRHEPPGCAPRTDTGAPSTGSPRKWRAIALTVQP